MIAIACLLLAFFPPGILFPQMGHRRQARKGEKSPSTGESQQDVELTAAEVEEQRVVEKVPSH
jgi:hypothetical protein